MSRIEEVGAGMGMADQKMVEAMEQLGVAARVLGEAYGSLQPVSEGSEELVGSAAQWAQSHHETGEIMRVIYATSEHMASLAAIDGIPYSPLGFGAAPPDDLQPQPYIGEPINLDNLRPDEDYDAAEHDANVKWNTGDHVKKLDFASTMQPTEGRELPQDTKSFTYVTIDSMDTEWNSIEPAGYQGNYPDGVVVPADDTGDMPYIDAGQAIGLTKTNADGQPQLRALAAAGMDAKYTDALLITQVQAHTPPGQTSKERWQSGLYSGFDWRKTLVTAWEQVAKSMGIERVGIQSAVNSDWSNVNGTVGRNIKGDNAADVDEDNMGENYPKYHAYDDVARDMGYTQDPVTENWYKRLK